MSPEDAAKVLLLASVYDNRTFDEMTARAWADALDGLDLGDCLDAVKLHFSRTKEWLMPVDVRISARECIRNRFERENSAKLAAMPEITGPGNPPNADPDVVHQRMDEIRKLLAEVGRVPGEDSESPHPPADKAVVRSAKQHRCSWCRATPGAACTNTITSRPLAFVHEQRLIAAGFAPDPVAA